VNQQLAELSERALEAAQGLGDEDIHQKIGFLRIAALSAWQAGPEGAPADAVVAGDAACEALEAKQDLAQLPRDCTMIRVAGPLHAQDAAARELEEYLSLKAAAESVDAAAWKPRLIEAAETSACQVLKVTRQRQAALQRPVPVAFWRQLDRQRLSAYCNARNAAAEYAQLSLSPEEVQARDRAQQGLRVLGELVGKSYPAGSCRDFDAMTESWQFSRLEQFPDTLADLGSWPPRCPL
jgi:hypothetical protein